MREILFRGQTRRYGEKVRIGDGAKVPSRWVYGGVLQGKGDHSIIYGGEDVNNPGEGLDKWAVYTDTLGQFTGETDKNGKRIFEGDIISYKIPDDSYAHGTIKFRETNEVGFCVEWFNRHDTGWLLQDVGFWAKCREIEVIGNIHDNPELLEDIYGTV